MLMMAHGFSPNADHYYGRGTLDSQALDHSNRPFTSVTQPEYISTRKTHKHTSTQPNSRSTKTTLRKSATMFDWEQLELHVTVELRRRVESGYMYKHHNSHANHNDHAIDAVFVGYRFTVDERNRMRSAHVDDSLSP